MHREKHFPVGIHSFGGIVPGGIKSLGLSPEGTGSPLRVHNREMKLFFWD